MPFSIEDELRTRNVLEAMFAMQRASWEQGTAAQAVLELNASKGPFKDKLDKQLIVMAHDAVVRQDASGRLAIVHESDPGLLDPASCVPAVLQVYKITANAKYGSAVIKQIDYLMGEKALRTRNGILSHRTDKVQLWVDGIYMGPPALAAAGLFWANNSYLKESVRQILGYHKALWNSKEQLFSHIWDEASQTFEREAYWGVGNGWAIVGMTRVLLILPDKPAWTDIRKALLTYTKRAIDGVLARQRPDHLFHNILDDPSTFVETNVGQQIAYSIFKLVYHGLLSFRYLNRAMNIREAVHKKVDEWGLVQGVCGSPKFTGSGTAAEGQAFFLMMEAAYSAIPYYGNAPVEVQVKINRNKIS